MTRDLAAKRRDKGRVSVLAHLPELTAGASLQGTGASVLAWGRLIPDCRFSSLSSGSCSVSAGAALGAMGQLV